METTLIELKATLSQLAAGEASGPMGLLIILAGFPLLVWMLCRAVNRFVELYAECRILDAEKRRKWLEGDE